MMQFVKWRRGEFKLSTAFFALCIFLASYVSWMLKCLGKSSDASKANAGGADQALKLSKRTVESGVVVQITEAVAEGVIDVANDAFLQLRAWANDPQAQEAIAKIQAKARERAEKLKQASLAISETSMSMLRRKKPTGLRWESVGTKRPGAGKEILNANLSLLLEKKTMSPQGLEWIDMGSEPPESGSAFVNEKLSEALLRCQKFSLSQFEEFDVGPLFWNSYIQSGPQDDPTYYSPEPEPRYVELTADEIAPLGLITAQMSFIDFVNVSTTSHEYFRPSRSVAISLEGNQNGRSFKQSFKKATASFKSVSFRAVTSSSSFSKRADIEGASNASPRPGFSWIMSAEKDAMHGKCSTGIAAVEINVHKMGASSSVLSRAGMTRASSADAKACSGAQESSVKAEGSGLHTDVRVVRLDPEAVESCQEDDVNVHMMGASSSILSKAALHSKELHGLPPALPLPVETELFATLQPGVQFGITMTERPNDGAVAVKTVDAGSAAEAQGVRVGFLVREVGSKSCAGLQTVEVIDLFKTVRRPCRLKLSLVDYI